MDSVLPELRGNVIGLRASAGLAVPYGLPVCDELPGLPDSSAALGVSEGTSARGASGVGPVSGCVRMGDVCLGAGRV